jgi:MATE family multidrug resistance protein
MGTMGIIFIAIPSTMLSIFTSDKSVIAAGIVPLRIMGAVQMFDGIGMTMASSLQGAGMNRWVMVADISISWGIFLPLTYVSGILTGWGLPGAWSAAALYLVLYAVACSLKFAGKKWQSVHI